MDYIYRRGFYDLIELIAIGEDERGRNPSQSLKRSVKIKQTF
ncbi:unnamed protein product [Phyllotreta striolata]|uniref:Uncharacterized protein n=1 Tax=Phyllotreta striolata TaxID=444603 RepID=A0A9N9TW91_PHYSR|nr:unnamed protein product [Phyllotreta striolata]